MSVNTIYVVGNCAPLYHALNHLVSNEFLIRELTNLSGSREWFLENKLNFFCFQIIYSQATFQINSVTTINPSNEYHSDNYKQGFHFDKITEFMLRNLNTVLDENPLIPLFNSLVDRHRQKKPAQFGSMRLNSSQFNLSNVAQESFGKRFEPEMLKFFNTCGSIVQTQGRWWRSGLLYGKLSQSITQNSRILPKNCPWPCLM